MAHVRPKLFYDFRISRNDLEIYASAVGVVLDRPNQCASSQRVSVVERRRYADFHKVIVARF
jgi:hypothetical protein